ncbi:MAG: hypothetical protein M1457_11015 [bacterium]|nr:hypothetical protein [bacterium]
MLSTVHSHRTGLWPLAAILIVELIAGVPRRAGAVPVTGAAKDTATIDRARVTPETKTSDGRTTYSQPHRRNDYTSRPLLAVGTLKSIDAATSTVTIAIDRSRSVIPHILLYTARRIDMDRQIVDREFPPERTFNLDPRLTMLIDARPNPDKPQTKAVTGRMREDRQRLPFSAFQPGDQISIHYRMNPDPSKPPYVLNMSKVDPNQKTFMVDFNPMYKMRVKREDGKSTGTQPTTATLALDAQTTRGLGAPGVHRLRPADAVSPQPPLAKTPVISTP